MLTYQIPIPSDGLIDDELREALDELGDRLAAAASGKPLGDRRSEPRADADPAPDADADADAAEQFRRDLASLRESVDPDDDPDDEPRDPDDDEPYALDPDVDRALPAYLSRAIDLVVVHCLATPPSADVGVAEVDGWHRDRGWDGCGYHVVIRRDGGWELGRPWNRPGAHARGHNLRSIGIALAGGVTERVFRDPRGEKFREPEDNFTPAQYDALEDWLRALGDRFPQADIVGHRDLPRVAKACPCFDVEEFLDARGIIDVDRTFEANT